MATEDVLWSVSFAEERSPVVTDKRTYLAYTDQSGTAVSTAIGGQPTIVFKGNGYKQKFTAAHEYAHVLLTPHPIPGFSETDLDYCT